ncbi:MAG: hypothetical protein NBKEAIPA_02511 [Nitrospirae bacterium]|nr:hypothetical protein [Nitrospirota bacterium]
MREEATAWFVRQAAGNFSEAERRRLEGWCAQSPAHARAFRQVRALWDAPELGYAAAQSLAAVDRQHRPARWWWPAWGTAAVAACLLLVMALGGQELMARLGADYRTGVGEQRAVTLSDQSIVTLNTDSAIAVRYHSDRRIVQLLRGEASFAVRPDPDRPFTVGSRGVETTALGTQFVVRADGDDVRVTVLNGSVQVTDRARPQDEVLRLSAGDQVSMKPDGAGSVVRVDAAADAAWLQHRLVFVRTPLAEVVRELARYHHGAIFVWNSALRSLPVTGIYNLSDPSQIVATLADTLPIHLVRLTDRVIIIR